jgi:hypothetical protein
MESEGLLPCSEDPTIGQSPEPDESSVLIPYFPNIHFNLLPIYSYMFQVITSL